MPLSPAAAARIAGVSRSLISKEVKAGRLPASINNETRHISINEADLQTWMDRRVQRDALPEHETPAAPAADGGQIEALKQELAETKIALAKMEGQAEATAARLSDLTADRDAWRTQAQQLASEAKAVPVSFLGRLFGR